MSTPERPSIQIITATGPANAVSELENDFLSDMIQQSASWPTKQIPFMQVSLEAAMSILSDEGDDDGDDDSEWDWIDEYHYLDHYFDTDGPDDEEEE